MQPKVEEWIPVPQFLIANKGKVDRNLVYRLISEGEIPSIRLGTKKLLIPSNAFDLIAEAQASNSTG
jgi:excisionase family DNA binding protein